MKKLLIPLVLMMITCGCTSLTKVGMVHFRERGKLVIEDRTAIPSDFIVSPEEVINKHLRECPYTYYCQLYVDDRYYYLVADHPLAHPLSTTRGAASVVIDGRTGKRKR